MTLYVGIDIGTTYTKAIVLESHGKVVARTVERIGIHLKQQADRVLENCLHKVGKDKKSLAGIALTGFGRRSVERIHSIPVTSYPDVLCICNGVWGLHSAGKIKKNPGKTDGKPENREQKKETLLILDVGGEKWKCIHSQNGRPKDFRSNDMCAVGTGKFLDYVAKSLKTSIDHITTKALKSKKICDINQVCGIFVEAEIISKLSRGEKEEDLYAGMFRHMFKCINSKASAFKRKSEALYLTGGVSKNVFLQKLFKEEHKRVIVPRHAQFTAALGASLFLFHKSNKNK